MTGQSPTQPTPEVLRLLAELEQAVAGVRTDTEALALLVRIEDLTADIRAARGLRERPPAWVDRLASELLHQEP